MNWFSKIFGKGTQTSTPEKIAIEPDDYAAKHVGWTADGNQFFLSAPFEPKINGAAGCDYIALYKFDAAGLLTESRIVDLGPREAVDEAMALSQHKNLLKSLGVIERRRIEVQPFVVDHHGTAFGLIVREPDDEGDDPVVEAQPGNYMAFFEPWDSGEYDT